MTPGWSDRFSPGNLPREARDTLWLLGMLALVIGPHLPRLPWWSGACAAMALLWRTWAAWRQRPLPSRPLLVFLLGALLVMTWLHHGTLLGRESGISLVVMLATLKSLELKARRDALVCMYLGFFLIFTQFLFSQSIATAALMLLGVWGLLCSLILGQRPLGYPTLKEVGWESARAMLWGIPLMVTLFVLFPRIGPLWGLPEQTRHSTGLSDSLALGDVASLAEDTGIALRIRFMGPVPSPSNLYFRGPTLDLFDGQTWKVSPRPVDEAVQFEGAPTRYLLTVEPNALQTLVTLDGTRDLQIIHPKNMGTISRHGLQWWRADKSERRLQVLGTYSPQHALGLTARPEELIQWLKLPYGSNPATRQWTRAWQTTMRQSPPPGFDARSALHWSQALLQLIHRENFRYTLSPGRAPATPHTIDHFWTVSRAGFCEHFASSYVFIMRSLGIPARIVTGYQGAERNPIDGLLIVRNSNAHAWAEIWVNGLGWQRVDPTAAVAPERILHSPVRRPFEGLPGPLADVDPETLRRLREVWESVDHRWNEWVLQYSNEDQMDMLRNMGWASPDWEALGQALAGGLSILAVAAAVLMRLRQGPTSPWHNTLRRLDRALRPLLPDMREMDSIPASTWYQSLSRQWQHTGQADHTARQQLLQSLLDLDAARYGQTTERHHRLPPELPALMRKIEHLAKTCRSIPTR